MERIEQRVSDLEAITAKCPYTNPNREIDDVCLADIVKSLKGMVAFFMDLETRVQAWHNEHQRMIEVLEMRLENISKLNEKNTQTLLDLIESVRSLYKR